MTWRVVGDWGTSRLRLFRISQDQVLDRVFGPGIGALETSPDWVLRDALSAWRRESDPSSIALCGMVGSRIGWTEVAYLDCPVRREDWVQGGARLELDGIPVHIAAGVACAERPGMSDVMRGEETQIFGAIGLHGNLASGRHAIVLPGTHSKWAIVEDGAIVAFRTYPTGELYAVMKDHSILVGNRGRVFPDAAGFTAGAERAATSQELIGALFEARSAQLRLGRTADWSAGYLSGLLIGSEIREAMAHFKLSRKVLIIGDPLLAGRYEQLLLNHGIEATAIEGDACALAGLSILEHTR